MVRNRAILITGVFVIMLMVLAAIYFTTRRESLLGSDLKFVGRAQYGQIR